MESRYIPGLPSISNRVIKGYIPKPNKDFEIDGNKLLKLLRTLYGPSDSGDYWNTTFSDHIKTDVGMQTTPADYRFFIKKERAKLMGLMGTYVDDTISAGSPELEELNKKKEQKFESKAKEYYNFRLAGVYVKKLTAGCWLLQESYIKRLNPLSTTCDFSHFRSARARLTLIQHTTPEIAATVYFLSQCSNDNFKTKMNLYNDTIEAMESDPAEEF